MSVFVVVFFFFKQKTAYEMRISDWSSDVCSSDLNFFLSGVTRIHPLSFQRQRSRPNALAVSGGAGFFVEKRLVPRPAFPSTTSPPPASARGAGARRTSS